MAIYKGRLINQSTGDIMYPKTSYDMIEGLDDNFIKLLKDSYSYYYYMTTPDGQNWLRTTKNGFIPYENGVSDLGTSGWQFRNIYGTNIYDEGVLLENKFAPKEHAHTTLNYVDLTGQTISLNNITLSNGVTHLINYYCKTDSGGNNITGRPNDNLKCAFNLKVELTRWVSTTDYITKQTYTIGASKQTHIRYCISGIWSPWEKVYTSVQKPTLAELGAAASAHTHSVSDLTDLEIGGRNLILNSAKLSASGLGSNDGSRAEYRAINVGQSYMNVPNGTEVVISFDLEMTVNTANPSLIIYNGNYNSPKTFDQKRLDFVASAGTTIKQRCSVVTVVRDRVSPTIDNNVIEFYSTYGTSNWFKITNLKLEKGNQATDWTPAIEDTDAKISNRVNVNMLANSDFRNEFVNLLGKTSYTNTLERQYFVDCWYLLKKGCSLEIKDGYISVKLLKKDSTGEWASTNGAYGGEFGEITDYKIANLDALTFSIKLKENDDVISYTLKNIKETLKTVSSKHSVVLFSNIALCFFNYNERLSVFLSNQNTTTDVTFDVEFMKLEEGTEYTGMPPYQKALEYMKCAHSHQFVKIPYAQIGNGQFLVIPFQFTPPMRKKPSLYKMYIADGASRAFADLSNVVSSVFYWDGTVNIQLDKAIPQGNYYVYLYFEAYDY